MPLIGYKRNFKNLEGYNEDQFTVNFDLEYTSHGSLIIKNEDKNYFDVGDFGILLDEVFESLTKDIIKEYDNGVYILSICKYLVDKVPQLYSINYESKGMIDTYFKNDIISDYEKIKNNNKK